MNYYRNITIITLGFFMLFNVQVFSQTEETTKTENLGADGDVIYVYVDQMPEFPGGIRRYVNEHIVYPAVARENGIEGIVFLRFEVTKSGAVGKIELLKGVDPLLEEEAIRVIKELPKFIPGEQNGKKVNVWYSIHVTFKLN